MNFNFKGSFIIGLTLSVSACESNGISTSKIQKIDDREYYYNKSGELVISEMDLQELEKKGLIVRIKHDEQAGSLSLEPDEMAVLMQDRKVFFSELDGGEGKGEYSALVKKGSLRKNLNAIFSKKNWGTIEWKTDFDQKIIKPFAVVSSDVPSFLLEALDGLPLFAQFYEEKGLYHFTITSSAE